MGACVRVYCGRVCGGQNDPGSLSVTGEAAMEALLDDGGQSPNAHRQLCEILGHQTKLRMQQKAAVAQQMASTGHHVNSQHWLLQDRQQHEAAEMADTSPRIMSLPSPLSQMMPGEVFSALLHAPFAA